jgi:xylulokinase
VGGVTPAAAQATGLRPGTPVIAGSGDTFPTIVGCGAVGPGDAMISFGTTGLLTLTTRPLEVAAAGPHFGADAVADGGAVTWAANVLTCGRLLMWFQNEFGAAVIADVGAGLAPALAPAPAPDFATLDRCAATIPAGSEGLVALPHLMGRRTPAPDPHARGVLFGLTPEHTASHVYRALLESFGYAIRQGYETIRPHVHRIIATAGGAASPLWRQIMADILGAPVSGKAGHSIEHHPQASGSLGIAFLAAYATGQVSGFDAIRDTWLVGPELSIPDPSTRRIYDDRYRLYCHLDDSLATAFALANPP